MGRRNGDAALAPFADRLGREADHVIAREAGVSRAFVVSYRKRVGIPAYEGYKFGHEAAPAPRSVVARPPSKVARASARARTPHPTANAQRDVYHVVVDDQDRVLDYAVVATSLVEAVGYAQQALATVRPAARLCSVERLAPLLEP